MRPDAANIGNVDAPFNEAEDFHCITCSDQALPARVVRVDEASNMAQVEILSYTEAVDVSLVDAVAPGDLLLVHGGVALSKVEG